MLDSGQADFVKYISSILPALASAPVNSIGPGVFCYRVGFSDKDPDTMFFLWELYNRYQFLGIVVRAEGDIQPPSDC